jgi:hypothetical protein
MINAWTKTVPDNVVVRAAYPRFDLCIIVCYPLS